YSVEELSEDRPGRAGQTAGETLAARSASWNEVYAPRKRSHTPFRELPATHRRLLIRAGNVGAAGTAHSPRSVLYARAPINAKVSSLASRVASAHLLASRNGGIHEKSSP